MNINLVPLSFSGNELFENIISGLKKYFPVFNVQKFHLHINPESEFSKERNQYFSTGLIVKAIEKSENIDGKVLFLTDLDLYVPVLTYLFGEAQLDGKHSIVSVCRLHEEFYSGVSDDKLLYERTMKEVLHELGHNFGLFHCLDWDCVMHSSPGIEEVDIKGNGYCKVCIDLIKSTIVAE